MIRQSEDHDSGWGMAVYERADGRDPTLVRFPQAAYRDASFLARDRTCAAGSSTSTCAAPRWAACRSRTRIPFCLGQLLLRPQRHDPALPAAARSRASPRPQGDTDSEHFFNFLMRDYDPGDPIESLPPRASARPSSARRSRGLNFLFSDGERLYAYRLGIFELHWLRRPGQLLVASERVTDRALAHRAAGRAARARPRRPRGAARRAAGRRRAGRAARTSSRIDTSAHLRGEARGAAAAERGRAAAAGRVSRRFALLVNPASAGGRALTALPGRARRARPPRRAAPHGDHPQHRARRRGGARRRPSGRDRGGARRRRAAAPARGRPKGRDAALALIPVRARQRLRARARDPDRPARGRPDGRGGPGAAARRGRASTARPFIGHRELRVRLRRQPDRQRGASVVKGNAVYVYAALRALAALEAGALHGRRSTASSTSCTGYSVAVGNSKAYGGGMYRRSPTPSSTTASST